MSENGHTAGPLAGQEASKKSISAIDGTLDITRA
jgi:hypothetical protein